MRNHVGWVLTLLSVIAFGWYMFALTTVSVMVLSVVGLQLGLLRRLYLNQGANALVGVGAGGAGGSSSPVWAEALKRADVLPNPVTDVETSICGDGTMIACAMQGWRRAMEDGHIAAMHQPYQDHHVLAVFDGHCGKETAEYCSEHMLRFITEALASTPTVEEALQKAFLACDEILLRHHISGKSGCTACLVYVTPTTIYCANAGDSRAVLSRNKGTIAHALSTDHKPTTTSEAQRIRAAKGFVWNRRVNGVLALSRALGDFGFKQQVGLGPEAQAVTCFPEVTVTERDSARDDFIVVACDGIWDVMSSEQTVSFLHPYMASGESASGCHQLFRKCLSPHPFGLGCDNMSVVVHALTTPVKKTLTTTNTQPNSTPAANNNMLTPTAVIPPAPSALPSTQNGDHEKN
jgi:serine/threonine protein phosphatase PrpC